MRSMQVAGICAAIASVVSGQTVYMAGDSTMAKGGGGNGTDGWGQYLGQYLTLPVVNLAIAGRSARSYSDEGRFTTLIDTVKSGDFVIIEFGHNDGTSGAVDNGRQDAVGSDLTTTATVTTSNQLAKSQGAVPIVSSQTPDNIWTNGVISAPPRFVGYAQLAASQTSVTYVDHFDYVAQSFESIGENTVNTFYPMDHTHTSPTGANVVAQAFVRGLACGQSALTGKLNSAGKSVPLIGQCV
ncbi:SGNH hydrolase [Flammula alnicola]|nr:SGNH hydrolase [Flammula alnicola]